MKTEVLLFSLVFLALVFNPTAGSISIPYVSASQKIISPSPTKYTLFRLNVSIPYEARVGEDFSVYVQLWQGKNTSVYVDTILFWTSGNLTVNLIKNQSLSNTENTETLAVERNVTINIPKRIRWSIVVWYSVSDLDYEGAWTTGVNYLASVHVHPQTYDELASQVSDLQNQVTNLQTQKWGFIFIAVYLTATLGIAMPIVRKRRKTVSSSK